MTDTNKLKELAERYIANPSGAGGEDSAFRAAANPQAILWLIAEVERLNDELSACTEHPGGCGYWREAAKHRAEERDQIQAEIERFKDANREISETNIRRRDENVRLKAENEALREKLNDCAISLHGEMLQKYGGQMPEDMHPVTRRDYDRDMAEIEEYRAALEGGGR